MVYKFLDLNGLNILINKIKEIFTLKEETENIKKDIDYLKNKITWEE